MQTRRGTAAEIEKMADNLLRDGFSAEKDTRDWRKRHVATIIIPAHGKRFRFHINRRHNFGTLKTQNRY